MKIRLRYIAIEVPDSSSTLDIAEGTTVDLALASLNLPGQQGYLTLVNEDSVPVQQRHLRALHENDLLTIFSPLKGG